MVGIWMEFPIMILIQFSMEDHFIYTVTFDHETHPKHWNPGTMPAKGTVAAPFKPLGMSVKAKFMDGEQ